MKTYVKPMIEFIELKPEERLACVSGGSSGSGCCSGGGGGTNTNFWWWCQKSFPTGKHCNIKKRNNRYCR